MEINEIVQTVRKEGRISLIEGHGKVLELVVPEKWDTQLDKREGIFLIFDLFQIRNIALPFSEVSLDIVELATSSIIFHTPANDSLHNAPVTNGIVKFSLIKGGFWNRVLFNYGRPLIYQMPDLQGELKYKVNERFPLLAGGIKEMFLGPEGEVKIIHG